MNLTLLSAEYFFILVNILELCPGATWLSQLETLLLQTLAFNIGSVGLDQHLVQSLLFPSNEARPLILYPVLSELRVLLYWLVGPGTVARNAEYYCSNLWDGAFLDYGQFLTEYSRGTLHTFLQFSHCAAFSSRSLPLSSRILAMFLSLRSPSGSAYIPLPCPSGIFHKDNFIYARSLTLAGSFFCLQSIGLAHDLSYKLVYVVWSYGHYFYSLNTVKYVISWLQFLRLSVIYHTK